MNGDTTDDDRGDSTVREISKEQGMGCFSNSLICDSRLHSNECSQWNNS